ncbi:MAG: hypothetical protein WC030_01945 [Candidatus Paceibacterota bacterium]
MNTKHILNILAVVAALLLAYLAFTRPAVAPEDGAALQGKIDISAVCEGALAYMTFPDAASAEVFVAECKEGKRPEVIERYRAQLDLGDGAQI